MASEEDTEEKEQAELGHDPSYQYDVKLSVQSALAKLVRDERDVAKAVLMEGLMIEQYAEESGMPIRTVERRLAGAKENLKNLLSEWRVS
jgi:DNA-directed RNA polymerase specialized sigma24 family protein